MYVIKYENQYGVKYSTKPVGRELIGFMIRTICGLGAVQWSIIEITEYPML